MKLCTYVLAFSILFAGLSTANAQLFWDVNGTNTGGSDTDVADGTWGIDNFWSSDPNGDASTGPWSSGEVAVFSAGTNVTGASTVTVDDTQFVGGITFQEGAVTLTGGTLDLVAFPSVLNASSGITGTINSTLSGFNDLSKTGTGTVVLGADNLATFFGAVNVTQGTLHVTNSGALGAGGDNAPVTVESGGTLQISASGTNIPNKLFINGAGHADSGAIRKTTNNANTISGGIELQSDARIQSERNTLTISSNPVTIGSHTLTIAGTTSGNTGNVTQGASGNFVGDVSSRIIKTGQGVLTLNNANSGFQGKWVVNGGVLSWNLDNTFNFSLGPVPAVSNVSDPNYVKDWVTVDGGTLRQTNTTAVGTSFMLTGRGLTIGAGGATIETSAAASNQIYQGRISLAEGVTEATLTKTGAGELRVQSSGTQFFEFTQLVVKGGLYRMGNASGANFETAWGAVPSSVKTDAIVLDGGAIGLSVSFALHANRGITVAAGGGTFSGGSTMTVPGPLSGSGTLTMAAGGFTLQNPDNVNTFNGNVVGNGGTLTLSSSLTTPNFSGTGGIVSVASGQTFTVGSDGASTSYAGAIAGAGTFRKEGVGTLTLNPASVEWTNTGRLIINTGAVQFGTPAAGFASTMIVEINNAGTLDMNSINDTFGSLVSSAANTGGQVLQGTSNLTLGQTGATNRTFHGTITGTGTFTKAGGTFTQNLNGGNSLGNVNVNLGRLNFNGASSTGAVTVASTATLGGNGSVTGDVTVQSGGTLAAGTSIGTLGTGAVGMASGATFHYELNSSTVTSDLLNVNGALSLGDATFTGLDLAGISVALDPGAKFTLISYAGGWDSSTFAGIANGGSVTIGANTFEIKYDDTSAGSNGGLYSNFVTLAVPGAPGGLPGDFNEDNKVDAADYVLWRKNNGGGTALPNDGGLGTPIGPNHYNLWVANFGSMSGGGGNASVGQGAAGAVPEPSTVALLMLGLAALVGRRRGR